MLPHVVDLFLVVLRSSITYTVILEAERQRSRERETAGLRDMELPPRTK